jgi:hypothetical protein
MHCERLNAPTGILRFCDFPWRNSRHSSMKKHYILSSRSMNHRHTKPLTQLTGPPVEQPSNGYWKNAKSAYPIHVSTTGTPGKTLTLLSRNTTVLSVQHRDGWLETDIDLRVARCHFESSGIVGQTQEINLCMALTIRLLVVGKWHHIHHVTHGGRHPTSHSLLQFRFTQDSYNSTKHLRRNPW